ncbi:MAG: selenium-binding protein [Deltaproteobacteria bacterium]|nr:selenium-binding protein [Deltaproteobacteria bacterium]MBW2414657.1 selenium-binding protein [Deltaproteobacteria bacterium]
MTKLTTALSAALALLLLASPSRADETCLSPYMAKIVGQEDFVYVWTLGIEGLGDGQDKLVTIDVRPDSKTYGKVIQTLSVGGRNEAHHSGLTDDRRYLWAGGIDTSKIFVFDIHTDPAKPRLDSTIDDFVDKSGGVVGPHTFYALPGRMMITGLSNNRDHGGKSALVEYTNSGTYIATHWVPTEGVGADGYNYDVRVQPRLNAMLTSSFTGWTNYMMDFGKMFADPQAMAAWGNSMVLWDLHSRKPKKTFSVPGAPLEVRWAWGPTHDWAFTSTALTSKLWLVHLDADGEWNASEVADIGDPSKIPLPVDISIAADDTRLWVDTFMDGTARLFDISDPKKPVQIYSKKIGSQVNMVSQSWDGKRVYFSTSLIANWDKKGDENDQFVKLYHWNGKKLDHEWTVDFIAEKLGRAHQMRFGSYALFGSPDATSESEAVAAR